jgi:sterol desaturase/sphingolipid hydroxylase (fatty acid hydroxylase superfamily)
MKKWLTPALVGGAFAVIAIAEWRRPLRERTDPTARRLGRNFVMGGLTAMVTAALQKPLVEPVIRRTSERRLGLLNGVNLPRPLRFIASVLLLDYTLWWWHWLNHIAPPLWRFHLVHHVDRDLDSTTALRFHFGEMALAALFRAAQVRFLGVDEEALVWWQRMLLVSILFHHSNIRLPAHLERRLVRLLVTPRMHGIHHSVVKEETNSNWSSLLSCWDMLHGTFIYDLAEEAIIIGVPAWENRTELTIGKLLAMPFEHQRDDWQPPSSGTAGHPLPGAGEKDLA